MLRLFHRACKSRTEKTLKRAYETAISQGERREKEEVGARAWSTRCSTDGMLFEGRTYDRRWRSPCTNPAGAAEIDL
ncbi:hypothetical protein PUN28_007633 [Cardiocondyla obscurior]|uniref:Uncharacterized protein n=1 Tax=Cardiocondyla obscurior TaxID=286306 RepID=A0AAW2G635_9HYME